jgi:hypothetical protein
VARSPSAPNPLRPAAARLALAATVVGPSAAMAQGLLVPAGETLVPEEVRRLVVDEGRTALVVEELVVRGSARRFVLARALPAAPTGVFDPGAPLFDVLEHETAVLKPLRRELEERPFGPSVLTGALHRWRESERLPRPPPIEAPGARLALVPSAALVVDEPARTSTRTGQRRLPERVERYLAAEGMGPRSSAADRVLRNYPERSALLLFTLDAPGGAERFVVGPIAYRIPKGEADPIPVIPLSGVGTVPTGGTLERTYAWGTQPLVPTNDAVAIDREPWANPPPSGTVRLVSVMPTPSAVRSALLDAIAAAVDGPWRPARAERVSMSEAFERVGLPDPIGIEDVDALRAALGVRRVADDGWDDVFHRAFFERVEPSFSPDVVTLLHGYPARMAALARLDPRDPRRAERFEVYVGPRELGNAFGELTDPLEQRRRLVADQAERARLGRPFYPIDEGFLADLGAIGEAAGIAIGVDRVLMCCLGAERIQDLLCFAPRGDDDV